jgi:hypothetical protein
VEINNTVPNDKISGSTMKRLTPEMYRTAKEISKSTNPTAKYAMYCALRPLKTIGLFTPLLI